MPPRSSDKRLSPESFLAQAKQEEHATTNRGHLKIFLGASPGVGKTYSMLEEANALKREGKDVAIGIVETHGRKDTEKLIGVLEVIPRTTIIYREKPFQEMDLDAILERRPELVLVDELAHTNIEGSRHPKRYQDVEELLNAGINVYSTVNIQHIESLNDIVTKVTGVQVKETVPDKVLQQADEIELVDIPPKELQKRLQEGKVYVPEQAQRAIHKFFSQENLTALRELALRFTAERVDSQMLQLMQNRGIQELWPVRERLMVCVGDGYESLELVRTCHHTAVQWKSPWFAVHVDTLQQTVLTQETHYATQALQLAEELGGQVITLTGEDIIDEILAFAHNRQITRIIIGKTPKKPWYQFYHRSTAEELCRQSDTFKVLVVPTEDIVVQERKQQYKPFKIAGTFYDYGKATIVVAMAGIAAYFLHSVVALPNLLLVFIIAILYVAVRSSLWVSLYTTILSLVIYNYFFLEPRFTFSIAEEEHIFTISFFFLVAALASRQASRIKQQVESVKQNAERTSRLYEFTRHIVAAQDKDAVLRAIIEHMGEMMKVRVTLLLPEEEQLMVAAGFPHLDQVAIGAAKWAWKKGDPAGRSTSTLPGTPWYFIPMQTHEGILGVLGIEVGDQGYAILNRQKQVLDAITHQAALAIERIQLTQKISEAKVYTETERLRSALLSSISHDFRTPLSSIIGCVTNLQNYGDTLDKETKKEILHNLYNEADRLNRFIQNLLDMTRYGAGTLQLNCDWVETGDLINAALERLKHVLKDYKITVDIGLNLPLLQVDPILIEQVLVNILDNAANYSPKHSIITINARQQAKQLVIEVTDEGKGIPEAERGQIFDMFYRVKAEDSQVAGVGLGLSICKGIIEAHQGTIHVLAGQEGKGTRMVLTLPSAGASS